MKKKIIAPAKEEKTLRGLIFIISGPSGSGKTTLAEKLLSSDEFKGKLARSISLTTRGQRSGERDKHDYHFVSDTQFKRLLREKKILEWTQYLGYYYGTPKSFVEKQLGAGKNIILCLDYQGVQQIRRVYPKNTVTIFIVPPSIKVLRKRIEGRCSKTQKAEIRKRLGLAAKELRLSDYYDYRLVNESLRQAFNLLQGILLREIVNNNAAR